MTNRRPLSQLLVDSVRHAAERGDMGPLDPAIASLPIRDVLAAGSLHRIAPNVARQVARHRDLPSGWLEPMSIVRKLTLIRHLRALQDLRLVQDALDTAGVTWLAVKGPVVADHHWPEPALREYHDLDVVVDRAQLSEALSAVEAIGCRYVDRNWPLMRKLMRAEIAMTAPLGTPLDLHWHISVPRSLRREFDIDMAGMLSRRRPVELRPGHITWTLDPVDTVLHLAFHAAHGGAGRLMWAGDIWFSGQALTTADWRTLAARSRRARADVPIGLVIDRTVRLLGDVDALDPAVVSPAHRLWGRLARWRDLRHPPPGLPGDSHLGGTMYTSARAGLAQSVRHAVATSWSVRRLESRVSQGFESESDALSRDVPDPSARAEYLQRASHDSDP